MAAAMSPQQQSEESRLLEPAALQAETGNASARTALTSASPAVDHFQTAAYCIYTSHFLSAWGQRMWEFAVGLIMLDLGSGSLVLVSTFGLLDSAAVVLAGPNIGSWIDRTERLRAGCAMYLLQNTTVAVSALCSLVALSSLTDSVIFWVCVAATILFGAISSAGALGATLSVEREWTKALCKRDSRKLAVLNAGMRRIDLSCLILSPILVGVLMSYASNQAAVALIAAWNLVAWLPEWWLLKRAQAQSEALRQQQLAWPETEQRGHFLTALATYWRQPVLPAALALALLYLTALSFGLLTTAYLKWRGMAEAELSIYRGLGAVAGVSATFVFPRLHSSLGLVKSGALGITWQLAALTLAIAPSMALQFRFFRDIPVSVLTHFLVGGLIASRFGLWLFDLAVGQLLQELVGPEELGVVNGVQGSLASLFQSAAYTAGIVLSDPERFQWLMLGSWIVVATSACMYFLWSTQKSAVVPDHSPEEFEAIPSNCS